MQEKEMSYPCEITIKAVYRNHARKETITSCLNEMNIAHEISEKSSSEGKFVSYTLTATFESDDHLNNACTNLKCIDGFMMMI